MVYPRFWNQEVEEPGLKPLPFVCDLIFGQKQELDFITAPLPLPMHFFFSYSERKLLSYGKMSQGKKIHEKGL